MMISLTGQHELKVIDIEEKQSEVSKRHYISIRTETQDTNTPVSVFILFTEATPVEYIRKVISKFSPWHGKRLGKSITSTDFNFLRDKTGIFEIANEFSYGRRFNRIKI